ncbi:hypothetical protein AAZX31_01G094300 [Glycine max]
MVILGPLLLTLRLTKVHSFNIHSPSLELLIFSFSLYSSSLSHSLQLCLCHCPSCIAVELIGDGARFPPFYPLLLPHLPSSDASGSNGISIAIVPTFRHPVMPPFL